MGVLGYSILGVVVGIIIIVIVDLIGKKKVKGWALVKEIANDVVKATEQISSKTPMTSDEKKAYAMKLAKAILESQKININEGILSGLIEAAVFAMNFFMKEKAPKKS